MSNEACHQAGQELASVSFSAMIFNDSCFNQKTIARRLKLLKEMVTVAVYLCL